VRNARRHQARLAIVAVLVLAVPGPTLHAEISKADAAHWARRVHLLATPDEEKILKSLKDLADKEEFQRQFWARRSADAAGPNAWRDAIEAAWKRADALFSLDGTPGSESGCGQVMALLGEPQEVASRELKQRYDNQQYSREGARRPEIWTYRSRPGDAVQFEGGELHIALDAACRFGEGGRGLEELQSVARRHILRPEINYARRADGRLEPWTEPVALHFPVRLEPKLLLRARPGAGYAAGILLAGPLPQASDGSRTPRAVRIVTQALDGAGTLAASAERTLSLTPDAGGSLLGSWGVAVKPGRYSVRVEVSVAGGTAVATTEPIDVPDFDAPRLTVSPLLCYPEGTHAAADPLGPYAAFSLGPREIAPRPGNVFTPSDSLNVVATLYGGQLDPTTNHASLHASLAISREGKLVARGQEEVFEESNAAVSVGPVPLAGYAPGVYQIRLEARDAVAGTQEVREASFEVKP
jgi:GWxTD domain-containing protein